MLRINVVESISRISKKKIIKSYRILYILNCIYVID